MFLAWWIKMIEVLIFFQSVTQAITWKKKVSVSCPNIKGWFPYDRRRSQTIVDRKQSQTIAKNVIATIAEPTVAIRFDQRKCQIYTRVSAEEQTTWRTWKRKFCCKQTYLYEVLHLAPIQKVAFSVASDNDRTQFLCCEIWPPLPRLINQTSGQFCSNSWPFCACP